MTTNPLFVNAADLLDQSFDEAFGFSKVAGTRLSSNARLWEQEILKHVASELSYLPLEEMDIHFDRFDPVNGAAVGAAVFKTAGVNLPFIIKKDRSSDTSELMPMDVFEQEGVIHPITTERLKQAVLDRAIGTPMDVAQSRSAARGSNPYIGDYTGDTSPLEVAPGAGTIFGKSASDNSTVKNIARGAVLGGIAGTGLQASRELEALDRRSEMKGKSVTNKDRGRALLKAVSRGGSIGAVMGGAHSAAASAMGVHDKFRVKTAAEVADEAKATPACKMLEKIAECMAPNDIEQFRRVMISNPKLLQSESLRGTDFIMRAASGSVATKIRNDLVGQPVNPRTMIVRRDQMTNEVTVKFSGQPAMVISNAKDLKDILGDNFESAMMSLKDRYLYVATENVNQASWSSGSFARHDTTEATRSGTYSVETVDGLSVVAAVIDNVFHPGGTTRFNGKLVITRDGLGGFAENVYGKRLSDELGLVAGEPKVGVKGVFVVASRGVWMSTSSMKVKKIVALTEGQDKTKASVMIVVADETTGAIMSLVPSKAVTGFVRVNDMSNSSNPVLGLAQGEVFYIPDATIFIPIKGGLKLPVNASQISKVASVGGKDRSQNHSLRDGEMIVRRLGGDNWEMTTKVASLSGITDDAAFEHLMDHGVIKAEELLDIERGASLAGDSGILLAGIVVPAAEKVASAPFAFQADRFDSAIIAELRSSAPEMLKHAAAAGDEDTVNAVLSLNFLNTENMRSFVDNVDEFDRVSTKLAKLLIATRLGLPNVREASVKEAMDGMARTCDQLRLLQSSFNFQRGQAHGST